jgi:membrane-bound serine protease (ClpP class)
MRKEFRATAESRKRPPLVAEAMVDPDVEIRGVIAKGKLLTLTTDEALKLKVADFRADTLEAVLKTLGIADADVRRMAPTWAESVVRFLTNPVVSSLLMTVGILGVIVELRTPGFGAPGVVGIASLGLFFWGHWIVRLAGWEELLLVALGLILLAAEIFVIPGFGVPGVLGLILILAGLGLSIVGAGATWDALGWAVGRVAISCLLAIAGGLALLRVLPHLPVGRRLVLATELPAMTGHAPVAEEDRRWLGRRGTTSSPLRPAGIATIDGERVDVVSEGEFIDSGRAITVVRVDGNRIVVRLAEPEGRTSP